VTFENVDSASASRLEATVDSYKAGPAALTRASLQRIGLKEIAAAATHSAWDLLRDDEPSADTLDSGAGERGRTRQTRGIRGDRRSYTQRVISLGDELSRVLLGRDLSVGGMRVESHPDLRLGDQLSVALHARDGETPLVVRAEVVRDDGERGIALQFRDLSSDAHSYLARMLACLPPVETCGPNQEIVGLVVSEILEVADA
jgi:hypothetical protein